MNTTIGQQYAAAHATHYVEKDLRQALALYTAIIEAAPETPEAGYCRIQLQNIANSVVPKPELLAAAVDLTRLHLPATPVEKQALSPGTVMAGSEAASVQSRGTP